MSSRACSLCRLICGSDISDRYTASGTAGDGPSRCRVEHREVMRPRSARNVRSPVPRILVGGVVTRMRNSVIVVGRGGVRHDGTLSLRRDNYQPPVCVLRSERSMLIND